MMCAAQLKNLYLLWSHILSGKSRLWCYIIVVTTGAIRFVILAVWMTISTIPLDVVFIKYKPGDFVPEILLVPSSVAGIAMTVQLAYLFSGRMTGPAFQIVMILVERPTGGSMAKCWFTFVIVAMSTVILDMTIGANRVFLFFGLGQVFRMSQIMAIAAILFLMTINALESKKIDVFIVIKGDDRTWFIRSMIYL